MHLGAHQGRHRAPRRTIRTRLLDRRTLAATAVASLLVTGVAVGAETVIGSQADAGHASETAPVDDSALGAAADRVSRGTLRPAIAELQKEQKERAAALKDPRAAARKLLEKRGWADQFPCLDALWNGESGWDPKATNAYSGAYGIPQSLPASKMASAGEDWRTNPITQIKWGLGYIESSYGSPCSAQSFKQGHGWY